MKKEVQKEAQVCASKAKSRIQGLQINHIMKIGLEELKDYVPLARISLDIMTSSASKDKIARLGLGFECKLISY